MSRCDSCGTKDGHSPGCPENRDGELNERLDEIGRALSKEDLGPFRNPAEVMLWLIEFHSNGSAWLAHRAVTLLREYSPKDPLSEEEQAMLDFMQSEDV